MNYWLLLLPLLSMMMGWLLIKLLLFLLFRPFLPTRILGMTFQGILVKQKQKIASKVGAYAASMVDSARLEDKISDPKNVEKIKPFVETHVDHFLRVKLKEQMPMISMFVGDKTINTLKSVFMQEIENLFPQVMQQFANNLKTDLDIEQMVVSKIENISPSSVESAFYQSMRKEIRMLYLFGALAGLLIGIIQLVVVVLTN